MNKIDKIDKINEMNEWQEDLNPDFYLVKLIRKVPSPRPKIHQNQRKLQRRCFL